MKKRTPSAKDIEWFIKIVIVSSVSFLLKGWVLTLIWAWFIVPIGMPILSIAQALGINLVVSFFAFTGNEMEINDDITPIIKNEIIHPLIILAMGYVISLIL